MISNLILESSIGILDLSKQEQNACFECGNCCRNLYSEVTLGELQYFIGRGFTPLICKSRYMFDSIKAYPSYPDGLYVYSESFEENLGYILDVTDPLSLDLKIEIAIIGECINYDNQTNMCLDHKSRPEFCRNFPQGSEPCNARREEINLPKIAFKKF